MGLVKKDSTAVRTEIVPSDSRPTAPSADTRDTKTKQIQAQGVIQAALQSPVLQMFCSSVDEYEELVIRLANRALKFIEEKSK